MSRTCGAGRRALASPGRPSRRWRPGWTLALLALPVLLAVVPAHAADEFERIREKAAEMAAAVQSNRYDTFGEGKDSGVERTYGDFSYLVTPNKISGVRELVEEAASPEERALRQKTYDLLFFHTLRSMSAALFDNARDAARDNVVRSEGDVIVLRGLEQNIAAQTDQEKRRKWFIASEQLYTGMNVYLLNLLADLDRHAKDLGAEGFYPFLRASQHWDVDLLASTAESVLVSTEATYASRLDKWSQREMGVETRRLRTYDALRLAMLPKLKENVSWGDGLAVAKKTLKDLGYDVDNQRTMRVDVKSRPGQVPGANAYQLGIGKCRVLSTPLEYPGQLVDLLGALGEAEFYQNMRGDLRFEEAFYGNNIVPSVFRALIESIVEEPTWVSRHLKLKDVTPEEVADGFRFRRLLKMREAAGNLLFQVKLHEDFRVSPAKYNEIMERALLWKRMDQDANAYLSANDDYLSGGYLLGTVLAAQIRDNLRAEWGAEWYRNPELAKRLTAMAQRGYALELNEFLALWKLEGVEVQALLAKVE